MKQNKLSKKQLAVLDDIFDGDLAEEAVLAKYDVGRRMFERWLRDETFEEEFSRRVQWLYRRSRLIIARYSPLAAAKLVQLTESEKEETARRACLDIINMESPAVKTDEPSEQDDDQQLPPGLCKATAAKLLAVLAEANSGPSQ